MARPDCPSAVRPNSRKAILYHYPAISHSLVRLSSCQRMLSIALRSVAPILETRCVVLSLIAPLRRPTQYLIHDNSGAHSIFTLRGMNRLTGKMVHNFFYMKQLDRIRIVNFDTQEI